MRVLIFGGNGLLGLALWREFQEWLGSGHTFVTVRNPTSRGYSQSNALDADVTRFEVCEQIIKRIKPDVIVNAAGIVKQIITRYPPATVVDVNARFPHLLSSLCHARKIHLVHISTDCVFSGRGYHYIERDTPDPVDFYGRSKLLGEVTGDHALTLRTSFVGFHSTKKYGLFEWFKSQAGKETLGYTNAYYTGVTTTHLARRVIECVNARLVGLYHVAGPFTTKYTLLQSLNEALNLNVTLKKAELPRPRNMTLDGSKLDNRLMLKTPTWERMLADLVEQEMATDPA